MARKLVVIFCFLAGTVLVQAVGAETPRIEPFGVLPDGSKTHRYTLIGSSGFRVELTDYGAAILGIFVPDPEKGEVDVVLGFDDLPGYLDEENHAMGGTVGRFAGRIALGKFSVAGKNYQLSLNDRGHHLNGGRAGFYRQLWRATIVPGDNAVVFQRRSPDGEEGYPGNLDVQVTYRLDDANALHIEYFAVSDRPTIVNLTNHAYFNLSGCAGSILEHTLELRAKNYLPQNDRGIPDGSIRPVEKTAFDFRKSRPLGETLPDNGRNPPGYNHGFALDKGKSPAPVLVAELADPRSGRWLKVFTTEPGLLLYTGNFLAYSPMGKSLQKYAAHSGVCLETLHFSDSPNHPAFPSVALNPGEKYRSSTVYAFGTKSGPFAGTDSSGSASPTPAIFASSSFWYRSLPKDAPLHPQSEELVKEFLRQKKEYYGTVSINTVAFSSPVYLAERDTPKVEVVEWDSQNKNSKSPALAEQWKAVPIPAYAEPADGSDAEMSIYQPSTDTLWEFWNTRKVDGQWQASWGGRMVDVSKNPGIWSDHFGATGTSLPFLGGQLTAEELRRGKIDHVIGIALVDCEDGKIFSWPAQRSDGVNPEKLPNRIPEGQRFRLDPSVDVEALPLPPAGKAIARAAQQYGFVVWDRAGAITLRAENAKTWTRKGLPNPYPEIFDGAPDWSILHGFPWEKLQFLPFDYGKPDSK
jgi:galactose mutarotase-like enzyme